jgi:hypothetical protein
MNLSASANKALLPVDTAASRLLKNRNLPVPHRDHRIR